MIDNIEEYRRMFEVEQKLWWYRVLHQKVLKQIFLHFGRSRRDLKILDAACGTGGLLSVLRENGFSNISGFDYSHHAVSFSQQRGLDVERGDLRNPAAFRPEKSYDLICCNDALYFLNDEEITSTLKVFRERLNKDGILLINIHAFEAFSGTHDIAVGSSRRFTLKDFNKFSRQAGLSITRHTYWPFFLSIPIWMVRSWQRFQLRRGSYQQQSPDSDVKYPGDFINTILLNIMRTEQWLVPTAPFGSSLFLIMKPA